MKKLTRKQMLLLIVLVGLVALTGCKSIVDANGITKEEYIIYLTTPWKSMFENDSFFSAIIVYPLAQAVNFVGKYLGSVAAVIIVTVVYNILILPLSIKSTVSSQKMQMLQPEVAKIQAKYEGKDDDHSRMMQAQEVQQLYNKLGINPIGSLITPLLQFPILIAMYYAVQRADVVVHGSFMGIELITTPLNAFKNASTQWPIIVIFVLMGVAQFLSSKVPGWLAESRRKKAKNYRKYKDAENPAAATSNMMIYGIIALVVVMGINWPAAMSVYWFINSVVNIAKTVYIQRRYVDHE